jgi:hypothetical protein
MKTLNFYHQKRRDGGIRTGVDLDGEPVLEEFKPGRRPVDSALEWFVDVRCSGRRLPADAEAARAWLLHRGDAIGRQLAEMADELRAGIDPDWPLTRTMPKAANGVEVEVVCSAIRRLTARDIRQVLLRLKGSWQALIASLHTAQSEVAA